METTTDINMDDIMAFNRYHLKHSSHHKRMLRINWICGFLISIFIGYLARDPSRPYSWAMNFAAATVVYSLVMLYLYRVWIWKQIREHYQEGRNKGLLGQHQILLTPDALIESTEVNVSTTKWAGVERIEETADHILIYIAANQAHIIPKRSFENSTQAANFLRLAKKYGDYSKKEIHHTR